MKYYVTYLQNHVLQGMLVEAPAVKVAEQYLQNWSSHARSISAREATYDEIHSGLPVLTLQPEEIASLRNAFLASHLEELDFSVRTYNALRRAGIDTIGDLVALSEEDLYQIHTIGFKGREEIKRVLLQYGETLSEHSLTPSQQSAAVRLSDAIAEAEAKQQANPPAGPSHMHDSVISVAQFADNPQMRDAIMKSDQLRHMTLDACSNIPGYLNLDRADRNQLYSLVQKALSTVYDRQKGTEYRPVQPGR